MSLISAITGHSTTTPAASSKGSASAVTAVPSASGSSDDLDDALEISSEARSRLAQQSA